jgi:hypothetical protein
MVVPSYREKISLVGRIIAGVVWRKNYEKVKEKNQNIPKKEEREKKTIKLEVKGQNACNILKAKTESKTVCYERGK